MIEFPEEPPSIDFDELPLFSGFITDAKGRRVASAFILRVEAEASPWDRYYSHAYLVTALHAVFNKQTGEFRQGLVLEFPWMEQQGLARTSLEDYGWAFIRPGDLPDGETVLDLAVAPLRNSGFTGIQFGRSTRAVDLSMCELDSGYRLLGLETVSVGLFVQYNGNANQIDPILRFGRIAAMPRNALRTEYGNTEAILVESSSAEGMSGAPVFVRGRIGQWSLLGIHVGHYNSSQQTIGQSESHRVATHTSIGIVVPAWRLDNDLLHQDRIWSDRRNVDAEISLYPWRFIDRRHRELRGVVLAESYFQDMSEYADDDSGSWDYLFYRVRVPGGYDERFTTGEELEWNRDTHAPLADRAVVVTALQKVFGPVSWIRSESRLQRGTFDVTGDSIRVDLFIDDEDQVLALRLTSKRIELTDDTLNAARELLGQPILKVVDLHNSWELEQAPEAQGDNPE